eukprot:CAMPEP_0184673336 /NCGR_PEP_ID=MMETSP0308-20130426/86624_1 /TAXON_ID=38269 /ORGANISM="Gloeochaete witrockiana, Strain SAG 46.84" /LENGTH=495 /DNA_ID=CAMNT_0027120813 /DNA_START=769 /DNA_END=2256 /DNA_ORIENTATION=+
MRLGYPCLNLKLREQGIFNSRSIAMKTIKQKGIEEAKARGMLNVLDLEPVLRWNEERDIRLFRLSSDLFPFASHPEVGYDLSFAQKELVSVGELAQELGHRLTFHPGQYTQLASPRAAVVDNAVLDLAYHPQVLDLMRMPDESIFMIHMGGVFGDKGETLGRFSKNYESLPENVKRRLVLENDDRHYSVEDLLPLCQKLDIPMVLDWHHNNCLPSSRPIEYYVKDIASLWERKGIRQKQHQSEPRPGKNPCTHSNYVQELPPCGDVDLMIEAKMKEKAVLHLYRKYPHLCSKEVWRRLDENDEWPCLDEDDEAEEEEEEEKTARPKRSAKRKAKAVIEEETESVEIEEETESIMSETADSVMIKQSKTERRKRSSAEVSELHGGEEKDAVIQMEEEVVLSKAPPSISSRKRKSKDPHTAHAEEPNVSYQQVEETRPKPSTTGKRKTRDTNELEDRPDNDIATSVTNASVRRSVRIATVGSKRPRETDFLSSFDEE